MNMTNMIGIHINFVIMNVVGIAAWSTLFEMIFTFCLLKLDDVLLLNVEHSLTLKKIFFFKLPCLIFC